MNSDKLNTAIAGAERIVLECNRAWLLKKYASRNVFIACEHGGCRVSALSSTKWWLAEPVLSVG